MRRARNSRVVEDDAVEIIVRVFMRETQKDIAARFGITQAYVSQILHGAVHPNAFDKAAMYWKKHRDGSIEQLRKVFKQRRAYTYVRSTTKENDR